MEYIIALGNPGEQYTNTRHNLAWRVADVLVEQGGLSKPDESKRYRGFVSGGSLLGVPVAVLYPTTFMNKSGEAAAALVPTDKRSRMIVLHDEVALPLGRLRISLGSGAAGHNGVASVIERCGTKEFIRVRLGVGAPPVGIPLERYVLAKFFPEEEAAVADLVVKAVAAVQSILIDGVEVAMNKFNPSADKETAAIVKEKE